jgi:hypothetical protein
MAAAGLVEFKCRWWNPGGGSALESEDCATLRAGSVNPRIAVKNSALAGMVSPGFRRIRVLRLAVHEKLIIASGRGKRGFWMACTPRLRGCGQSLAGRMRQVLRREALVFSPRRQNPIHRIGLLPEFRRTHRTKFVLCDQRGGAIFGIAGFVTVRIIVRTIRRSVLVLLQPA